MTFGKSAIHDWGLFSLEDIGPDEMVIEMRTGPSRDNFVRKIEPGQYPPFVHDERGLEQRLDGHDEHGERRRRELRGDARGGGRWERRGSPPRRARARSPRRRGRSLRCERRV